MTIDDAVCRDCLYPARSNCNVIHSNTHAKVKEYNQWAQRDLSGSVQAANVDSLLQYTQEANGDLVERTGTTGLQVSEYAKTEIVRLMDLNFRATEEQELTR